MPIKTTALVDDNGHPTAADFYKRYPRELTLPKPDWLMIGTIVRMPSFTMVDLLKELAAVKTPAALICTHGTSSGLNVDIFEGRLPNLSGEMLNRITEFADGKLSESDFGDLFPGGIPPIRHLGALAKGLEAVRKRKLDRIDIRACNVGSDGKVLEKLRGLFNCDVMVAPTIPDAYGKLSFRPFVPASSSTWKKFKTDHPRRVEGGSPGSQFAVDGRKTSPTHWEPLGVAESQAGVRSFEADTAPLVGNGAGDPVLLHAFFKDRLIFPQDPAYREKLKKAG